MKKVKHLHIMRIPPNRKRKATPHSLALSVCKRCLGLVLIALGSRSRRRLELALGRLSGVFEIARGEDGFLAIVESDGAEFLPVRDEGVFGDDFVDGEFALQGWWS